MKFNWIRFVNLKIETVIPILIAIFVVILVLPSISMGYEPFHHVDFVNEYASYIGHGEYLPFFINPFQTWWVHGNAQLPGKFISFFIPLLESFQSNLFSVFVLATKINFLIQILVASFSMYLLTRELLGKGEFANIISPILYSTSPFFLSWTTLFTIRTWMFVLLPLAFYFPIRVFHRIREGEYGKWKGSVDICLGSLIFAFSLYFSSPDSIYLIGIPLLAFIGLISSYLVYVRSEEISNYLLVLLLAFILATISASYIIVPRIFGHANMYQETNMVLGHSKEAVSNFTPSVPDALQTINVEHRRHFENIGLISNYPNILYTLPLNVLSILGLFLSRYDGLKHRRIFIIFLTGVGLLSIFLSTAFFVPLRNFLPFGYLLRKPYIFEAIWALVLALGTSYFFYLLYNRLKKDVLIKLVLMSILIFLCLYSYFAIKFTYTVPYSGIANYEEVFDNFTKVDQRGSVEKTWEFIEMSKKEHRFLGVSYLPNQIHIFKYDIPGFTNPKNQLNWIKYYQKSPSYENILSSYSIKYVIAPKNAQLPLKKVKNFEHHSIFEVEKPNERVFLAQPIYVVGGPNFLSSGYTLLHHISEDKEVGSLAPLYLDSSKVALPDSTGNIIAFHNSSITDLVANRLTKKHGIKLVNLRTLSEISRITERNWKIFQPRHLSFKAPKDVHDTVFGQNIYGYYALRSTPNSKLLTKNFEVSTGGNFKIGVRVAPNFRSKNTGNGSLFKLSIINNRGKVTSQEFVDKGLGFKWRLLDVFLPEAGRYTICLEPLQPIYLDTQMLIVNAEKYERYRDKTIDFLKKSNLWMIFEPSAYATEIKGKTTHNNKFDYFASDRTLGVISLSPGDKVKENFYASNGTYKIVTRVRSSPHYKEDPILYVNGASLDPSETTWEGKGWKILTYRTHLKDGKNTISVKAQTSSIKERIPYHFVTGVIDGNEMKIYLDGELQAVKKHSYKFSWNSIEAPIVIGYRLDGTLDDLRLYNTGMNESMVKKLYRTFLDEIRVNRDFELSKKSSFVHDNLELWLTFDNTITDFSGNGRDGVYVDGMPTYVDGILGKGVKFGPNRGYLKIPDFKLEEPSKITITAWVKSHSFKNWPPILRKFESNNNRLWFSQTDRSVYHIGYNLNGLGWNFVTTGKIPAKTRVSDFIDVIGIIKENDLIFDKIGSVEKWSWSFNKGVPGVDGRLSVSKPAVLVFAFPYHDPPDWFLNIPDQMESVPPINVGYMYNGYLIENPGQYEFQITFSPSAFTIISRILYISIIGICTVWLLLTFSISYKKMDV